MAKNPKNAAAQRRWRRTKRGKAYMRAYNKKTVKDRSKRVQARREMVKKYGKAKLKGKSIHHKNGNPQDNRLSNLSTAPRYHGRRKKKKK